MDSAVKISAATTHTCAITMDGGVKCWGARFFLGADGSDYGPSDVPGLRNGVTLLAAGPIRTCAAKEGRLYCWGASSNGQLGDGIIVDLQETPVEVRGLPGPVSALTVGLAHTLL
jgi:alpha-tubulin suppressor-like RCC1 family protein